MSDATGALYGTAIQGGSTGGYVYKYVPSASGGSASILFTFPGGNAGSFPAGPVLLDASGAMYGVTEDGGRSGFGVIYKLTPTASGYVETVLHSFSGPPDGEDPSDVGLATDGKFLWGTTYEGGDKKCDCGILFSISTAGSHYAVRHTFTGPDGSYPTGDIRAFKGDLYGVAISGGPAYDGVVYRYRP